MAQWDRQSAEIDALLGALERSQRGARRREAMRQKATR